MIHRKVLVRTYRSLVSISIPYLYSVPVTGTSDDMQFSFSLNRVFAGGPFLADT